MTIHSRKTKHSLPLVLASTVGGALNSIFRRRTLNQLERLDDRSLRDVGLTRADIESLR
ncbi:MAG: DUF1127 domain-containing protein, partial [Aestuariivirga sp.]